MKKVIALVCISLPAICSAAEFDNAMGVGVQYGGIIGWQGSVTEDKVHGRLAVGLAGIAVGGDLSLNNNVTVGVTAGAIAIATFTSFNVNYYAGGR